MRTSSGYEKHQRHANGALRGLVDIWRPERCCNVRGAVHLRINVPSGIQGVTILRTELALKLEDHRNNPRIKLTGVVGIELVLRISLSKRCNVKDLLLETE